VPFRLSSRGRPEVALAWKALIGMSRSLAVRVFAVVGVVVMGVLVAISLLAPSGPGATGTGMLGFMAAATMACLALYGPVVIRQGLATALRDLDFLRTLPLSGTRIVLGHAMAPAVVLSALWLLLVPVVSLLLPVPLDGSRRTALALALLVVGPPSLLLGVLLQAFTVVLLPSWSTNEPGPLAIGRNLLASVVQFIGFPLLLLPAAIVAAVLGTGGYWLMGWPAIPLAAAATAAVVGLEAALAVVLVGRILERLEPGDL
jgi:hypothetical protein